MATKAVLDPVNGENYDAPHPDDLKGVVMSDAGPAMPLPSDTPALPEGFVRLSDTRRKQTGDAYAPLRPFVGRMIQLDGITIAADGKSGTMEFSEFHPEGLPEGVDVPKFQTPIPKGAIRAIVAAHAAHPDDVIVTEVVQTKRGMALR